MASVRKQIDEAIGKAFVICRCQRYDLQEKSVLKTQEKFYLSDASLKYCMMGFNPESVAAMPEIRDHYLKYVVTLDALATGNINGVKIVHLADYLLRGEY